MSTQKIIDESNEFINGTTKYYIDSYILNNNRISDLAAHSFGLRTQLIEAVKKLKEMQSVVTELQNQLNDKENA